jgi:hypothetical protein
LGWILDKEDVMDRRHLLVTAGALGFLPSIAKAQDAETERYIGSTVVLAGMMQWFYETVGELFTNYTEDQFTDESWRIDVLGPFSIARAAQDVISTIAPPAAFEESYDYFSQSIDTAVDGGDALSDGILNGDVAAMTQAGEHLQRSKTLIDQAVAAIPA